MDFYTTDVQMVQITDKPSRVDQALLEALRKENPEISRNILKSWFQDQKIYLSGRSIKPSHLLTPGTYTVELRDINLTHLGTSESASPSLNLDQIQIAYEDAQLLVLNKPSGMPSVPHSSGETETAVGLALAHCPELRKIGRNNLEPGLLHRLDTGTSGLLVFAKSQSEYERLSAAWKNHEIKKTYRAWVYNKDLENLKLPWTINTPLGHDAKSSKRMLTWNESSRNAIRGKPLPAVTHLMSIHTIKKGTANKDTEQEEAPSKQLADLEIQIETGVMHQIRCHLASIHCPIIGDLIYNRSYREIPDTRLWLHAWLLTLPTVNGQWIQLEAKLPLGWDKPQSLA